MGLCIGDSCKDQKGCYPSSLCNKNIQATLNTAISFSTEATWMWGEPLWTISPEYKKGHKITWALSRLCVLLLQPHCTMKELWIAYVLPGTRIKSLISSVYTYIKTKLSRCLFSFSRCSCLNNFSLSTHWTIRSQYTVHCNELLLYLKLFLEFLSYLKNRTK